MRTMSQEAEVEEVVVEAEVELKLLATLVEEDKTQNKP